MSKNNRIFVVAWEYPPILSGESVVCRKTLQHSTFNYDVCCGPVNTLGDDHVRLYPTCGSKYLRWPFAAASQFRTLDVQEHYTIMMSRVMPPNGHLAGWLIKRLRPDLKWVAYFSDPIWNSPFLKFSLRPDGAQRPNWLLMKVFGLPAKWSVREADLLVFNNERLARYVLGRRYSAYRDKVVIAPYGHEGVFPRPLPERGDGKFRLTHVGQIYGSRNLKALVEGVELLQRQEPALFRRLELRLVGFVCEAERRRVECSPTATAFTLTGQVPYSKSIEEMYAADCLLVIDPVFDDPYKNIYIPGKIYDYMSTGRPILCIADRDSTTGDVAQEMEGPVVPPESGAVCAALLTCLTGGVDAGDYRAFHCQTGVGALDRTMADLLNCEV